jgi:hypothetical protein
MSSFSDKRIIKQISNEPLKHKEKKMHPITLEMIENKDPLERNLVLTQFTINKDETKEFDYFEPINTNIKKYRTDTENLLIPNLSLPLSDILLIYDISNYDELIKWLQGKHSNETIYRVVNTFTRIEFKELQKTNNRLIKILKMIFEIDTEEESIINFLNKWFKKKDEDDFNLNICEDFKKKFLSKYNNE